VKGLFMVTVFIKIIFVLISIFILFYCSSYAKFEITEKNNITAGIAVFLFSLSCVVFSDIIFWIN
jgi:hypothetical protein